MEEFGDAQLVVFRQLHNHFFQARNLGLQGTDLDLCFLAHYRTRTFVVFKWEIAEA
jgi:hypothetical protein